jgi:hypothetical protein
MVVEYFLCFDIFVVVAAFSKNREKGTYIVGFRLGQKCYYWNQGDRTLEAAGALIHVKCIHETL